MSAARRRLILGAVFLSLAASAFGRSSRADAPPAIDTQDDVPPSDPIDLAMPVAPAPVPFEEPRFPFLDDEDESASVSIGDVVHGYIVNAKKLTESDFVGILPRQKERDLAYGTSEIVAMIEETGRALHEKTGTKLWIGDIGRRGGGDIIYSVSHNSGRDADIALAYTDKDGKPVDPPDLVPLDGKGESKTREYRFDAARTWLIVRTFLEWKGAQVQFMFLSEALKHHLLVYAESHKEPRDLIARAVDTIHQPGSPHNDHLHLRIYCGSRDLAGGCVDSGIFHSWVHTDARAKPDRIESAAHKLEAAAPELRARAAERLALLGAKDKIDAIAKLLHDDAPVARASAATAIGTLASEPHAHALAAVYATETDLGVKTAILGAMREIGGNEAGKLLASAIASVPWSCPPKLPGFDDPLMMSIDGADVAAPSPLASIWCTPADERALLLDPAIRAAGFADRLEPVKGLLAVLEEEDPTLRALAADALGRITNRSFGDHWGDPTLSRADRDRDAAAWRAWATWLEKVPREAWIANGFLAAGFKAGRLDSQHVWEIVRALGQGGYLAYNAHKQLLRIAGRPMFLKYTDESICADWLAFFSSHLGQFQLEKAPEATVKACAHPRD